MRGVGWRSSLIVVSGADKSATLNPGGDVGLTLAWKEPVSSIYGSLQQGEAEDELAELEAAFPSPADLDAAAGSGGVAAQARVLADRLSDQLVRGEGIGRIAIDRIG